MNDATNWLIDLLLRDVALAVGGITILFLLIEFIRSLRDWMKG
jgi:hypothetical protein